MSRRPDALTLGSCPAGAALGPLPVWAASGVGGALLGESVATRAAPAAAVGWSLLAFSLVATGLVGVSASAVARRRRGRDSGGPERRAQAVRPGASVLAGLLGAVLVVATSMAGVGFRVASTDHGLLPDLAARGGEAEIVGKVVAEPRRMSGPDGDPGGGGWLVLIRTEIVDGRATRERAAMSLQGDPPVLGSRWRLTASARPLPEDGYGRWLARQHAVVLLGPGRIQPVGGPGRLGAASERVRSMVRTVASRHLDAAPAGLLVGFVTGDTRLLPEADDEAMRASGMSHLTAVSGSNLAIVLGGVLAVTGVLRVGVRGRWLAVGAVIPWFAFVTRFEPSVLRAGVMAALLLLVRVRGHVGDARHALAVTVLLLVLVDPRLAGSLGLALSVAATAGVLVVAPAVRTRLPGWLPRAVAELVSITLGAQIAVLPLLLVAFETVGTATVPANLLGVPVAAVASTLGFLGSAVALVHPGAGALVFALAGVPARAVLGIAHTFASWDGPMGGTIDVRRPATTVAVLTVCLWLLGRRSRLATAGTAVLASIAVVLAVVPVVAGALPREGFSVTAIDVGQGDAFLVETPGSRILVDAGSDDAVARWLVRNGRRSLDLVVVTHPHLDHVGGVAEVLRRTRVAAVWTSTAPTQLPEAVDALTVAAAARIPVRSPPAGTVTVVGDTVVEVLHPPPGRPYRYAPSEPNETSIVLRVHHGGRRVLLTGDIEREAQADLLDGAADLTAELLTVPHHGAGTSDPAFLTAVGARVGLVSVGADNPHGHPHPTTLDVLDAAGVVIHRTDRDGTLRVAVPPRRRPGYPG